MSDEEAIPRVHPLRQVSVFIYAPLVLMDTFFILFAQTLRANALGAGPVVIVLMTPIYTLFNFLTGPFWGWMADKRGRRPSLIISGFFTVPALLWFALATEPWHLLVASAVRGIGGSAGILISRVLVADLAPRKALGERIAALSIATFAVPQIGMAYSGVLYDIDNRLPFIVAAIPETTALLLAVFAIPETLVKGSPPTEVTGAERMHARALSRMDRFRQGAKEWFVILRRRGAALYIFAMLMGALVGTGTVALPSFLQNLGLPAWRISLAYTSGMVIGLLGQIPGGILSDRIGRKWPVLFGGFCGALTLPLYTLVPGMANPLLGVLLINSVSSVAGVVGGLAFSAYFYEWVPTPERGRALAMTEFFTGLVTMGGFPLSVIYAMLTPESLFYVAAIAGIFVYIVVWAAWKEAPLPEEM